LLQIFGGQIMRSLHDAVRPSAEVVDEFFEDCQEKSLTSTTMAGSTPNTLHQSEGRLLVDLDDQTMLYRRQSANVIEQEFNAMDFTQHVNPRVGDHISSSSNIPSAVLSQQYYPQGTVHCCRCICF